MTDRSAGELLLPKGFRFSAMAAGIKASGRPDLAYVEAEEGVSAAALFTTNRVVAAPVTIGRNNLKASKGRVRAIVVNAGNANCATGAAGLKAAASVCQQAGKMLAVPATQIFPSSTGIIGVPLPVEKITNNLPRVMEQSQASVEGARAFAQAIMTTDSRPKWASATFKSGGKDVTVMGMAKGSGMIHPNLATMLVYVFTDAVASPTQLQKLLRATTDETFNCISVDGDTSTNDTILLCASGASGVPINSGKAAKDFSAALIKVSRSLAEQIVSDGEGVKHVVTLRMEQAKSRGEAKQVARAIAHSMLVKTAWAGADPNWGRILAAIGYSGVRLDPNRVQIFFGEQQVCRNGCAHPFDEKLAHQHLLQPSYEILIRLGSGTANATFVTCDLTADYVHINADYST
ncbi:MAG TPA: bifunctional glutamate N-acetyltransferase/amino-acid acetyltransferase ArgJ [Terriglobales bacterium]|nr:bifunctional glutamate N-acetyltransferase/amino-acid acetyltransferase ArgJ [Terriglobales bacterium]